MKNLILPVLFSVIAVTSFAQTSDLIGTWESYDVYPVNSNKEQMTEEMKSNFHSTITFNDDSTFVLVTDGLHAMMGKFSYRNGFITLFQLSGFENYQRFCEFQWSDGQDPNPATAPIDITIPTEGEVMHKKKETVYPSTVYALYKRANKTTTAASDN